MAMYPVCNEIIKAFLFVYVLFDYILVIFRNGWNYKHNSALFTLVTATVFLVVMMICILIYRHYLTKILFIYKQRENSVKTNYNP
jgi:uncharacterized membrane protein